jgi:hypothetical protein
MERHNRRWWDRKAPAKDGPRHAGHNRLGILWIHHDEAGNKVCFECGKLLSKQHRHKTGEASNG